MKEESAREAEQASSFPTSNPCILSPPLYPPKKRNRKRGPVEEKIPSKEQKWKHWIKAGSHTGRGQKEVRSNRQIAGSRVSGMKKIDGLKTDN